MKLKLLVGAAVVAMPTLASAASIQPSPGIYLEQDFILTATPANGGSCGLAIGQSLTQVFTYPGPSKTGASLRLSLNVPSVFGAALDAISIFTFPVTPAAGVTSWSGTATQQVLAASGVLLTQRVKFVTNYGFIDADSFTSTTTLSTLNSSNQVVCTNKMQSTFIRAGS